VRAAVSSLLLASLLALPAAASAVPATLHLSAAVYDVHESKGGVIYSEEVVSQGTKPVGEDSSRCTPTSNGAFHCVGSYDLTHGTLRFAGMIPNSGGDKNRLTVTGGTGAYKGARGMVTTEYNKAGDKAKETITFR